ncbi:MAG: 2-C-methyl-D-erythritol 4-phosphate cytidylyltransferase [Ktedonobacteraceae bacterium]
MQETCSAIIAAAGSSRRMQGYDKLWLPLAGRLTLARTIDVFDASPLIDSIVLVLNEERIIEAKQLCQQEGWRKIASIITGGQRRQDSVRLGLNTLARIDPQCRWVMIHDGARPLVTPAMLEAGLQAARQHEAAIAAVPVKDTIKSVEHDFVTATIDRSQHVAIQTPQVFSFPLIHSAHNAPEAQQDVTDDAALLERLGHRVAIFPGSYTNIKITTQEDVLIAEAFIKGATIL